MDRRRAYRIREFSQMVGRPESTCYAWAASGRIPAMRVGRSVILPAQALELWFAQAEAKARESLGSEDKTV